jgi:transmembrane sensor
VVKYFLNKTIPLVLCTVSLVQTGNSLTMSTNRLEYLFQRYLNNVSTIEENQELMQLLQQSTNDHTIKQMLDGVWNNLSVENRLSSSKADTLFSAILAADTTHNQTPVVTMQPARRLFTVTRIAAAAAVMLILSTGYYFLYFKKRSAEVVKAGNSQPLINDIPPGRNSAVLTLADGSRINLDNSNNGAIAQQGNTSVIKLDSLLSYNAAASSKTGEPLYNTISTARGNQYQVILPDGSRVWLNAESGIRFPIAFAGKERRVEVTGELYFDIKHNSRMPFLVVANGVEVHDLGTQFNINAYSNEEGVKTTLVEGKARVVNRQLAIGNGQSTPADKSTYAKASAYKSAILKPGQQAIISPSTGKDRGKASSIKVVDADVEAEIAWKNGQFMFQGNTIHSVMRQLERWYDVQVEYSGNVSQEEFIGAISRFGNISDVLRMLEKTGTVSFEIKGRKVIVK